MIKSGYPFNTLFDKYTVEILPSLMVILGAVFGGLFFLVTVVVCLVCIYCICKTHRRTLAARHTVMQPTSTTNTVYGKAMSKLS